MSVETRLLYGKAFAAALDKRLRDHFASLDQADKPLPAPLTVGLFGGWGSGKTLHLTHLRDQFWDAPHNANQPVTLPVLFNAWRHESEPHLIVPLLKTTHQQLNNWLDKHTSQFDKGQTAVWNGLTDTAASLRDAALALAVGLGSIKVLGLEVGNVKDMLEEDAKRSAARHKPDPATGWFRRTLGGKRPGTPKSLADLDAIYHDFENHLRALTGVDGKTAHRLNLLFLIDDLDRCLPEKAVQMLESIKLFLDVPGCAFVLALDDEVVERGIAHRYRDYRHAEPAWDSVAHALSPKRFEQFRAERDHQQVGPDNPVSGHEYLEKMVQLPVYVPRPAQAEVRAYLAQLFPALFDALPVQPEPDPGDPQRQRDRNAAENAIRNRLLELIVRAVPNNPRKLNRLAELYAFKLSVAASNGWRLESETERLTLLRLATIQLLAPALYRFGAGHPVFAAKLEQWLAEEGDKARTSGQLEERNRRLRDQYAADSAGSGALNLRQLERLDEPLLAHLRNAQHQRSRFDPFDLLDPALPCDTTLEDYYRLTRSVAASSATVVFNINVGFTAVTDAVSGSAEVATTERARLGNPRNFIEQLLAADPLAWRDALAQESEALSGRVLDDTTFAQLEAGIRANPEQVSLPWLELLAPHLDTEQLYRLYKAGDLLRRLNNAIPAEAPP